MSLSEDQKSLIKSTLPSIVGTLSGAVAVFSYIQATLFTQSDAKAILNKMQDIEERQARLEEMVIGYRQEMSNKMDNMADKIEGNGQMSDKEILGRIRDLDNNINRRIDNLYEKLIERKR